jgi:hypothetical protein
LKIEKEEENRIITTKGCAKNNLFLTELFFFNELLKQNKKQKKNKKRNPARLKQKTKVNS